MSLRIAKSATDNSIIFVNYFLFPGDILMVSSSRPSLTLDPKPMLVWTKLPEANSYHFTMERENRENYWTKEILLCDPNLESMRDGDIDYFKYPYPNEKLPLDESKPFLLSGEAFDSNKHSLSRKEEVVYLIEDSTQKDVRDFELKLGLDLPNQEVDDLPELSRLWLKAKESLLVPAVRRSSPWFLSHLLINF